MLTNRKLKAMWLIFFIATMNLVYGQEDSLESALNAVDRRQRDLSDYEDAEYGYSLDRPEDLTFLRSTAINNPERPLDSINMLGRPLVNYLEDDSYDENDKQFSSAFRERVEEDNQKQLRELKNFIANIDNYPQFRKNNYAEILKDAWDKYQGSFEEDPSKIDKRYYYPNFGMDAIGLRKRNRYTDDNMYVRPREDIANDFQLFLRKRFSQPDKVNRIRQMYSIPRIKRYPVSKRSSDYAEENDKPVARKQTDPKVEKDLSNIFSIKKNITTSTIKPIPTKNAVVGNKQNKEEIDKPSAINKELFSPVAHVNEKPLLVKKKSVDWSDYFGLDRRKKSKADDLDKEWLIERYHKSISMSAKKRNAEIPFSSIRNNDEPSKKDTLIGGKDNLSSEEKKIDDMGSKLKIMEDTIVDDALKYTGAHEGEADPKEIQEVKDTVISRLAAAYSLEKMRSALDEYKLAVSKERERLSNKKKEEKDYTLSEEKRSSVPRKQVVDEDRESIPEGDNIIKCADGNEDCHEQNYKTPSDIVENHFGSGECPAVKSACNEIASITGQFGPVFKSACSMHEMCLLCINNSWVSPTRHCNALYLTKTYELCKGSMECQREAQRSLRFLLAVSHSLRSQPSDINDCELYCGQTDTLIDPNRRR